MLNSSTGGVAATNTCVCGLGIRGRVEWISYRSKAESYHPVDATTNKHDIRRSWNVVFLSFYGIFTFSNPRCIDVGSRRLFYGVYENVGSAR